MTDRSVLVRLRADVSDFVAKSQLAKAAVKDLHNEIDKSNDRTAWLAQGVLALTPAVTRLGAGAVPVLSGMATQMMLTVAAAGTMALAFNGVGDALTALNDYQLDPTEEHLKKLNETMAKIGPEGEEFVRFLDSLGPTLSYISNTARGEMFPGVTQGLRDVMELAPQVNEVVGEIASAIGQLGAEAGAGISSSRFEGFFEYLSTRAKPLLIEMGRTIGNFVDGLAAMVVAFDPLTADFSSGLLEMSRAFAEWAHGLETSSSFEEFVNYVREAAPQALDFLGALVHGLVEIAEAAAPVGAVMLPLLTGMLRLIGDLADTPLGPITLGFLSLTAAWGRLNALAEITGSGALAKVTGGLRSNATAAKAAVPSFQQLGNAMKFSMISTDALVKSSWSYSQAANRSAFEALKAREATKSFGKTVAPIAGQLGLMAVALSGVDNSLGLTNTTSLALAGSLFGGVGAGLGATIGLAMDARQATADFENGLRQLNEAASGTDLGVLNTRIAEATEKLKELKAAAADRQDVSGVGDFFSDVIGNIMDQEVTPDMPGGKIDQQAAALDKARIAQEKLTEAERVAAIEAQAATNARNDIVDDLAAETAALEKNIEAMREKRAEAIRGLNAELDYKASLLDAKDALEENGATVNENTRKGQANLRALYGMAAAFNAQGDAAKDSAAEVRAGREAFVRMATAMGMGEEKARALAKELYELPAKVPIEIGVDAETALAHARAVKAQLDSIDRFIPVEIHVSRTGQGGDVPYVSGGTRRASGGAVYGPGTATSDSIPAYLSNGEYVIKAAAVQKYGVHMFDHLNAMRFADGGSVSKDKQKPVRYATTSLFEDVSPLQAALDMLTQRTERMTAALEDQQAALDASTKVVEFWAGKMSEAGQATMSQFGLDLFSKPSSPWAQGAAGGALGNLDTTNAGLTARIDLQRQLRDLGLSGDALTELLKGSNTDIQGMIDRGEIGAYAEKFATYQSLAGTASGEAGQFAYGREYGAAQEQVRQQTAAVQAQTEAVRKATLAQERAEKRLEEHSKYLESIDSTGPARTGRATADAMRGWGDGAASRGRRDR